MKIHKEGIVILIVSMIILASILIVFNLIFPAQTIIHILLYVLAVVFYLIVLRFFRSPKRIINISPNHVLCPADGKVVVIEQVYENEYFKDQRMQVSVFMSPSNVHINWYPIGGIIKYLKYHPGKFLVAWHPKSSEENERTSVVVESEKHGKILIRQIAGAVARRIVCYAKTGKTVEQDSQLGFIKFGSRVDLFLPPEININVKIGQQVVGGHTVIAT